MTFRTKLFLVFTLALLVSVGLIAAGVSQITRRAYDQLNNQHSDAAVAQYQKEFDRRGSDVFHHVESIADAEGTVRMAIDLSRPQADVSVYVNDAHGVAQSHQLDFLDFASADGSIISSAEFAARSGYKITWVTQPADWSSVGPFLMKVDTQDGPALALMAVSTVRVGDRNLYVIGGERLGKEYLAAVVLPESMRALLYENLTPDFQPQNLMDAAGPVNQAASLAPAIEKQRQQPSAQIFKIKWTSNAASAEVFRALPLLGRQKDPLGVLLVGASQRDVIVLERRIRLLAFGVVVIGICFGMLLSWWAAARVTRPLQELADGTHEISEGNWRTHVDVRGPREVSKLSASFNRMMDHLSEQRERLVQAERVAAWREIARRLAHELKIPLFPLETTVENLQGARQRDPEQFDEVFRDSTGVMLTEIDNLKAIVNRFNNFAKMPAPELAPVNVNDVARAVMKNFESQFSAVGRPPITSELHLADDVPVIQADAGWLQRALENLVLNAMDAMPAGGVLMMRTNPQEGGVHIEVSDTGKGVTPEESERLFTPYYTTKQHGSGLGLATVQSVVSDHGGRISVESEAGVGTSFHIFLPARPPGSAPLEAPHPSEHFPQAASQEQGRDATQEHASNSSRSSSQSSSQHSPQEGMPEHAFQPDDARITVQSERK